MVTYQRDLLNQVTLFRVAGRLVATEIIGALNDYLAGEKTPNILWDLLQADPAEEMLSEDIMAIVATMVENAGVRGEGKTAIVVADSLNYGLARMYGAMTEANGVFHKIRVFRQMEEALRWLYGSDDQGGDGIPGGSFGMVIDNF